MKWLYSHNLAVPLIEGEEHMMVSTRLLAKLIAGGSKAALETRHESAIHSPLVGY